MKQKTNEEIMDELKRLWPQWDDYFVDITFEIEQNTDKNVIFTVTAMYEPPGLSARQILALADFFGTLGVDTDDTINHPGCETCDYGSKYGFRIHVREDYGQK